MDSDVFRKLEFLKSHHQGRHAPYKLRILTKEEKDLQKWKDTYAIVKQSQNKYLELALRKMRLSKLLQFIKESLKNKKRKPKIRIHKPSTDTIKKRWQLAKQKGNEYSKFNKYNIFTIPGRPRPELDKSKEREIEAHQARVYGNMLSNLNLIRIQKHRRAVSKPELSQPSEINRLTERRRNLLDYGSYYSMRNKLSFKDSIGQFDNEYQDLLLKCVTFEKDHIEVTGFLEEKFRSNLEFRRGIMALAYQDSSPPPKERKAKKSVLVASPQHTVQIVDMERTPSNEVFISYTKIVTPPQMPTISSENIKTETVVSAYRYNSNDQLNNTYLVQNCAVSTNQTPIIEKPLPEEDSFYRISETVSRNAYFEDTVLDVMKNYRTAERHNVEIQRLLSDLYLAFCMNLMKTAVNEKFIKEEIDLIAVKDAAMKQADAMSEALNEIFRKRNS